ncbi:DUF2306 domain-containing protein [Nocardia alni]|uniref:DUF2306 domain-containing protein n=1 Tax=Nocardia alni TaxID=2815723 RepID=UPI001C2220D1|nr:DUF2306 domain-containing protein [Nocardia alni]
MSIATNTPQSRSVRRTRARWSWAWVTFSSVAIAAYFVGQYAQGSLDTLAHSHTGLATTYAVRPWPIQIVFYFHIVFAGLALILGPWQFSKRIRMRHIAVHRTIGKAYLVAVGVGGTAALIMSPFDSVGISGFFGFGTLALLWMWTAHRAYRAVRTSDIASHQAWMIRCFALTYAAVTLRLELGALVLVQLPFTHADILTNAYAPLPYICWLPNLVVAEFMIRRRGRPALYLTTSRALAAAQ